ncbi:MAG: hypothetical protein ABI458_04020 [Chloroflexota bacterium]
MIPRMLAIVVPVALLVACSSPASSGQESQGGGAGESSAAGAGAGQSAAASTGGGGGGGDSLASVDLTITGGEKAGHYQVEITGSGGCSTGVVGPGTFAVSSVTVDPAESFGGPQITIYDADAAASGTDSQFSAAFPFDNYAYTVEVNPYLSASQGGDFGAGTATLDNRGTTATLTIEGTTANGETVDATIECHSVANF